MQRFKPVLHATLQCLKKTFTPVSIENKWKGGFHSLCPVKTWRNCLLWMINGLHLNSSFLPLWTKSFTVYLSFNHVHTIKGTDLARRSNSRLMDLDRTRAMHGPTSPLHPLWQPPIMKQDVDVKKYCQQATYCQYLPVGLNKRQPPGRDVHMIIDGQGLKVRKGSTCECTAHTNIFLRP